MKTNYDMTKAKRGAVISPTGKTRITIYLDGNVLDAFRRRAEQNQTLINEALSTSLAQNNAPVTISTLRQILREELHAA